jgi:hypothetical protein
MNASQSSQDHLTRVFTEGFSVGDVAECLVSFDASTDAADVRSLMAERGYEVVGIRQKGVMAGYARRDELDEGTCGDYLHGFDDAEVVSDSTCFPTVVKRLTDLPRLFVTSFGRVGGIVTRSDLQKPPVRMWLFGMITIVEMGLVRLIQGHFPGETWREYLSQGRIEKAEVLLAERRRRNQELDLIDCLQLSDKGQIVLKNRQLREKAGFDSRTRGEETVKRLEALRNNLAHSQDIVSCDWDVIVGLTENLDKVMALRTT